MMNTIVQWARQVNVRRLTAYRRLEKEEISLGKSQELSEDWLDASIEVAAEYFFSEGINEDGLEQIIEEVGLENFVEFVTDPIDELSEERSARKASVRAPSYEKVKAKVDAKLEALGIHKVDGMKLVGLEPDLGYFPSFHTMFS